MRKYLIILVAALAVSGCGPNDEAAPARTVTVAPTQAAAPTGTCEFGVVAIPGQPWSNINQDPFDPPNAATNGDPVTVDAECVAFTVWKGDDDLMKGCHTDAPVTQPEAQSYVARCLNSSEFMGQAQALAGTSNTAATSYCLDGYVPHSEGVYSASLDPATDEEKAMIQQWVADIPGGTDTLRPFVEGVDSFYSHDFCAGGEPTSINWKFVVRYFCYAIAGAPIYDDFGPDGVPADVPSGMRKTWKIIGDAAVKDYCPDVLTAGEGALPLRHLDWGQGTGA